MIDIYPELIHIAESLYKDIVSSCKIIQKRTIGTAKIRFIIINNTFLDVWVSSTGKYSYHWEQRARCGKIYRHDNAPDHPHIDTFPKHLHDGDEKNIQPSYIDDNPLKAIEQILDTIRKSVL